MGSMNIFDVARRDRLASIIDGLWVTGEYLRISWITDHHSERMTPFSMSSRRMLSPKSMAFPTTRSISTIPRSSMGNAPERASVSGSTRSSTRLSSITH